MPYNPQESYQNIKMAQTTKTESDMIENTAAAAEETQQADFKGGAPLMRSREDDISVWQSVRRYKRVGLIAMAAAFCASLDGYRMTLHSFHSCQAGPFWGR
jgi:hypothetical protein